MVINSVTFYSSLPSTPSATLVQPSLDGATGGAGIAVRMMWEGCGKAVEMLCILLWEFCDILKFLPSTSLDNLVHPCLDSAMEGGRSCRELGGCCENAVGVLW